MTIPFGLNFAALALQGLFNPVAIRARAIGTIIADVTIEERHLDTLAITDHPVERDAVISDHAFMLPFEVVIRAGFSNSSRRAGGDANYVQTMYYALLALQEAREPFEILTGKRFYQDMLIHRLMTETTEATEDSMIFVAECRQVIIVGTQVISGAPNNAQANPSITGSTQNFGATSAISGPSYNLSGAQLSLPGYNFSPSLAGAQ